MVKRFTVFWGVVLVSFVSSCGGGGGGNTAPGTPNAISSVTTCTSTADDSQPNLLFADGRIKSHKNGTQTYQMISAVRKDSSNNDISIDYMVHTPPGATKALLVLIAGGNGDAKIEGTDGVGQPATKSGGNFLVRSAHLFAAQGYKVVTIDRPSDFAMYPFYDDYRTSVKHAVDLSSIINKENTTHLPVIIAGTSRGTISTVAQAKLADAITLSSPVTTGGGTPVDENGVVKPSSVSIPTHVMWHTGDGCDVSPPSGSEGLVTDFSPTAANNPISGGFNSTDSDPCGGSSAHGYYGIETCAVGVATDWMDGLSLPASKPIADAATLDYINVTGSGVDISGLTSSANGGALTISLPFSSTTLGGTVSLSGNTVTYIPPAGITTATTDRFVYVVSEAGGGSSHNVLSIDFPPP